MLDYLTDVDFVDHFAWAVLSDDGQGVAAQGRYIRRGDDREVADIAFDVFDEYQGRGLATMLLGALAVAASNAGIIRFVADVLYENHAMLAVLRKAHATWRHDQPGVVRASTDVSVAASLLDGVLRSEFARAARPVVTAAGLADTPPWLSVHQENDGVERQTRSRESINPGESPTTDRGGEPWQPGITAPGPHADPSQPHRQEWR